MVVLKKFVPSTNKEIVRREIDTPLVAQEVSIKKRKLSYFGLPSEGLFDILEWKQYLDSYDAVEKGEEGHPSINQHLVILSAFLREINPRFKLLRGDINEILLNGNDDSKQIPRFPFDIVNLDYYGGILHEGTRKVDAITKLIERQAETDFLLLMTFDVKEEDSGEKMKTLDKIEKLLLQLPSSNSNKIRKFIDWYKSDTTSDAYRQKVYVPYFLKHPAEDRHFKVHFHEPIIYEGTKKAPMVHFACKMVYESSTTTASVSEQSLIDILNLRMLEIKNGQIVDSDIQPLSI